MDQYLAGLTTEEINFESFMIDECTTDQMLRLINEQDKKVPIAVEKEIPNIAIAVDMLTDSINNGGRMFYIGAGTSGRLGVLDASECPPTFGTDPDMVQGYIAGGDIALRLAVEGFEDSEDEGIALINKCGVTKKDIVVGITASGSAAFVIAAIKRAKEIGASTIGVVNNDNSKLKGLCDVCIAPVVGPEAIMGSTRLKSGSAQKLVLNMLTTCTMVKLGKVYNNLMVDLKASNKKLYDRAIRIIKFATEVDTQTATKYLVLSGTNTKLAIMMIKTDLGVEEAEKVLKENNGFLKKAINMANGVR